MHYTIYKITNKINGKFYIGKHKTNNINDSYMGSGKLIKSAIRKYGIENFEKEILETFNTEEEMNEAEKRYVVLGEGSYNLCPGGQGGWGYVNTQIWVDDKRLDHNRKVTGFCNLDRSKYDWKQYSVAGNVRRTAMIKNGDLNPNTFLGKKHSEETIATMRETHKGRHLGEKNSQYGTYWITDGSNNKKIKKEDLEFWLIQGYYKGRILK
jgi:hypothetical protein